MTNPIINNPNVKLVPVETQAEAPKPKPRGYRSAPAGTRVKASDGTIYIKQDDGSLRRATPKIKGKKKRKRK